MFDYDKFFEKSPLNIHDQPERHSFIASLCRGHVCDLGCGTGSLSDYYKGKYSGFDVSAVAIKKAEENRRGDAQFTVCDLNLCKHFDFSEYDTIVMAEFLEHIERDLVLFEEIKRTARPNTRLIISVPNGDRVQSPDHVREFNVAGLRRKLAPFGDVRFHNWPGEDKRIIVSVDIGHPQRSILSLGVIAKNEGKGLERCILSCLNICDDIVVHVDDSSDDNTLKIAEMYSNNFRTFTWQNDFSAARNYLSDNVKTPWVLFLDGHEYLKGAPSLDLLANSQNDAFLCQVQLDNGCIIRYPRLHKTTLKYEDKVHNRLTPLSPATDPNILIIHDRIGGQDPKSTKERIEQRHEMICDIMGRELKRSRSNTRASMHLGLHFHARQEHRRAIKYYKIYLRYGKEPGERWFIRWNLALCYFSIGAMWRAEWHARHLESESPNRWENKFIFGLIFMAQKEYLKAANFFVNSLETSLQENFYKPITKDHGHIWNMIGECFFHLGKYFEASEAFMRARKFTKNQFIKNTLERRSKLMREMAKKS